jgi:hypothetical protein
MMKKRMLGNSATFSVKQFFKPANFALSGLFYFSLDHFPLGAAQGYCISRRWR